MKIFFTASHSGKLAYQDYYDKILEVIQKHNCEVISLEVQKYEDLLSKSFIKSKSLEEVHYAYIKKGMHTSDAIIIEASVGKFRLGYEAALGLMFNKPVLCVSSNKDYAEQIKNPNFEAAQYSTKEGLEEVVSEFIKYVTKKSKPVRFHGYLTSEQKNFLDWYTEHSKKNASEVIRELLDKFISENPDYHNNSLPR